MKITHYNIPAKVRKKVALLADFHSCESKRQSLPEHVTGIAEQLRDAAPDIIVCPGDILNHPDELATDDPINANGYRLFREIRSIAPVYYSLGNHEHGISRENRAKLEDGGITVLDNEYSQAGDICIGGLTTGCVLDQRSYKKPPAPKLEFIADFAKKSGFRLLLCHHPEYWKKYIVNSGIDLTVSGHAHGGQWGFFSRGVYAPCQGLFPKYVKGVHCHESEYLAISRGMRNTVPVPRFFNPCEIVILHLGNEE